MTPEIQSARNIKNCPCCGRKAVYENFVIENVVRCDWCGLHISRPNSKDGYSIGEDSIMAWEKRATEGKGEAQGDMPESVLNAAIAVVTAQNAFSAAQDISICGKHVDEADEVLIRSIYDLELALRAYKPETGTVDVEAITKQVLELPHVYIKDSIHLAEMLNDRERVLDYLAAQNMLKAKV